MKKLVVLTGSGISAESGLKTFRESGGLWEEYDVTEVATPEAWQRDQELVLRFYNERRAQLENTEPNRAHLGLVDLEKHFDVTIITQNVDNLHERAGSTRVVHLHGLLTEVRSTCHEELVYDVGYKPIKTGDVCEKGHQLRPNIVWFGEAVPEIARAAELAAQADIFVVIGTSLVVYPAAGLIGYVPPFAPIYVVDPNDIAMYMTRNIEFIKEKASIGVEKLIEMLTEKL